MIYDKIELNNVEPCLSFKEFVERIKKWYGEAIAFKDYVNSWSYCDLYNAIRKLLSYFLESETQYYCVRIDNPVYFCIAFFAITISGKIALLNSTEQNSTERIEEVTESKILQLLARGKICDFPEQCDCDKLSVIAQSSGTTSVSKGVMLSQKNLLRDTVGGMQFYDYPFGAIYYNVLPYYHLFGLVADMLGPLYSGGTICFSSNKLNFFKDIQIFKPTHMNLPPAMVYTIESMLAKTNNRAIATGGCLKKIMCAGAHLNESTRKKLSEAGVSVFVAYGLTECSPCISMNCDLFSKENSVGRVLPCCEVAIIDGEIAVRGDIVMLGYWNDSKSTHNTIRNGWLYTGDFGYLDDDGFLFLTGRKSNIIVFEDGRKIIPEIIEKDLNLIENIDECLVAKLIKNNRITVTITVVISKKDKKGVMKQIEQRLDKYGISNRISEIILTNQQLPKNKLGKIIRTQIT